MAVFHFNESTCSATALLNRYADPACPPGASVAAQLNKFSALALEDLGRAALLDRQETKFVFSLRQTADLLMGLDSEYDILEINGRRIFRYRSIYYDSPDLFFYRQHHAGARPRWKIRLRTYLDTGTSYLEIKSKDNHNRTRKERLEADNGALDLAALAAQISLPGNPIQPGQILETLATSYSRITLVHRKRQERITLDFNLAFSADRGSCQLPDLTIAEVKQHSHNRRSTFLAGLKSRGVQPLPFSKYCIGIVLLKPGLKHNRFKPILRVIKRLNKGGSNHEWHC